jgi:hypothetical protein
MGENSTNPVTLVATDTLTEKGAELTCFSGRVGGMLKTTRLD